MWLKHGHRIRRHVSSEARRLARTWAHSADRSHMAPLTLSQVSSTYCTSPSVTSWSGDTCRSGGVGEPTWCGYDLHEVGAVLPAACPRGTTTGVRSSLGGHGARLFQEANQLVWLEYAALVRVEFVKDGIEHRLLVEVCGVLADGRLRTRPRNPWACTRGRSLALKGVPLSASRATTRLRVPLPRGWRPRTLGVRHTVASRVDGSRLLHEEVERRFVRRSAWVQMYEKLPQLISLEHARMVLVKRLEPLVDLAVLEHLLLCPLRSVEPAVSGCTRRRDAAGCAPASRAPASAFERPRRLQRYRLPFGSVFDPLHGLWRRTWAGA